MFPRVEMGPASTVPRPLPNSGRICGAPLIGPPYIPGGCATPPTTNEAITSGGPVKSRLIIESLTRIRPTVSAMQVLVCKVSTPLPILASEPPWPSFEITPEKDVSMSFMPTVSLLAPKKTFPEPSIEPMVRPDWWPVTSR